MRISRILVILVAVTVALPAMAATGVSAKSAAEAGIDSPRIDPGFTMLRRAIITEGFEGNVIPPTGWVHHQTNATETWKIDDTGSNSGTYSARVDWDDPANLVQEEILYSPLVTANTALMVRLWSYGSVYWCRDDYDNCDLNIYLDDDTTWDNGNETLVYTTDGDWPASWTWAQSTVDLNAYADGSGRYIAFAYEGQDGAQISLDDIEIFTDGDVPEIPVSGCEADTTVLEEHFESWPPAGWAILNNGGDCVWESTATTGRTNYAGGDGEAAVADADDCGSGTTMDTELRTPSMDLSGFTSAYVNFIAAYNDFGGDDIYEVDVSDDGGATWSNLMSWDEDHDDYGPGVLVEFDLTPYLSADVILRFHYSTTGWDYYAEVDDVFVCGAVGAALEADLEIAKTSTRTSATAGRYTINVENLGPDDATGVVVTDSLPAGVAYVSDDCGGVAGAPWTWAVGGLAMGASATCNIEVSIIDANDTANVADVTATEVDPNTGNNTATAEMQAFGGPVPTLGTVGVMMLTILIAGAGIFLIRRLF